MLPTFRVSREGLWEPGGNLSEEPAGALPALWRKRLRMRKSLVVALTVGLLVGAIGMPAEAGKKKKKKKAPATETISFTEEGSLLAPAPTSLVLFGLTDAEFLVVNECGSMPATQGHDAWIVEIPPEYADGTATVEVKGSDATGAYDLDLYFYDAGCGLLEPYVTDGVDPSGTINAGAAWGIVTMPQGANATFELTATATVASAP